MTDRLQASCERELARYVGQLFEAAAELPNADDFFAAPSLEIPFIGNIFVAGHEPEALHHVVAAALLARARHRVPASDWAQPFPLRRRDCDVLAEGDCPRLCLVGCFANSMRMESWSVKQPSFHAFGCGLMADPLTFDEIRTDRELLAVFPAAPLDGMHDMAWLSPATRALHARIEQLAASG
jgi:hypothetical protein